MALGNLNRQLEALGSPKADRQANPPRLVELDRRTRFFEDFTSGQVHFESQKLGEETFESLSDGIYALMFFVGKAPVKKVAHQIGQVKPPSGAARAMNPKPRRSRQPLVGIWWDNGQKIVTVAHTPDSQTAEQAGMLDSELTHADQWSKIASKLGRTPDDDYFLVPRGRVLHERKTGHAVIYHGNYTSRERLAAIAKAFRLRNWVSRLDEHYSMGTDIDELFD